MSRPSAPAYLTLRILHAMQKGTDKPRATTHHHKPKTNRTRTQPTATIPTSRPTNDDDAKEKTKKRQVRGLRLGVVAELGVRIVDEVRVHDAENTRGNPNPKRGLGFPST